MTSRAVITARALGPGYKAGEGWDYPTGWGTPDGVQLIRWLVKHQPVARADDLHS